MRYNIILIGPPACGKGTQAEILSKKLGIPVIKPGALFRKHIAEKTELGLIAKDYVEKGDLLPDHYTNNLIKGELAKHDISNGVIIDGYPRSLDQVHVLEDMLPIDFVLYFNVRDEVVKERIMANERGRKDDTPEIMEHRLEVYHANYDKIIEYYREKPYFHELDAEHSIEEVSRDILNILKLQ